MKQKEVVGVEEERGTNSVQIQTLIGRWPRLKHQKTTPKSPCGLTEDKWSANARWLNLTESGFLVLILKLLAARNARNFNKDRKYCWKRIKLIYNVLCTLAQQEWFFFFSREGETKKEVQGLECAVYWFLPSQSEKQIQAEWNLINWHRAWTSSGVVQHQGKNTHKHIQVQGPGLQIITRWVGQIKNTPQKNKHVTGFKAKPKKHLSVFYRKEQRTGVSDVCQTLIKDDF